MGAVLTEAGSPGLAGVPRAALPPAPLSPPSVALSVLLAFVALH